MLLRVADFIEIFEKLPYIPRYVIQEMAEIGNRKLAVLDKRNDELEQQVHTLRTELNELTSKLHRAKTKLKTSVEEIENLEAA